MTTAEIDKFLKSCSPTNTADRMKSLSDEDIAQVKAHVEFKLVDISSDIAAWSATNSNPKWIKRAKFAKGVAGIQHQAVLREICNRKHAANIAKRESVAEAFIHVAKSMLDRDTFMVAMKEAEKLVSVQQDRI